MPIFDPHFSLLSMSLTAQPNWSLWMCGLFIALPLTCFTLLAVRRLFLHPLSQFPGPKLASLTSLYKSYHEVIRGGKWLRHVDDLHKAYGTLNAPNMQLILV